MYPVATKLMHSDSFFITIEREGDLELSQTAAIESQVKAASYPTS